MKKISDTIDNIEEQKLNAFKISELKSIDIKVKNQIEHKIKPLIGSKMPNIYSLGNDYNYFMNAIKNNVDQHIDSNMDTSKKFKELISKVEDEFAKITDFERYIK